MRWAMVLHTKYPWDRSRTELRGPGEIGDDDFVVAFHPAEPRRAGVHSSGSSARNRPTGQDTATRGLGDSVEPVTPYPPVVRGTGGIRGAAEVRGAGHRARRACLHQRRRDQERQPSPWSPMSADEIAAQTGIEQRLLH